MIDKYECIACRKDYNSLTDHLVRGYVIGDVYGSYPVLITDACMNDGNTIDFDYEFIWPNSIRKCTCLRDDGFHPLFEKDIVEITDKIFNTKYLATIERKTNGMYVAKFEIGEFDFTTNDFCDRYKINFVNHSPFSKTEKS